MSYGEGSHHWAEPGTSEYRESHIENNPDWEETDTRADHDCENSTGPVEYVD